MLDEAVVVEGAQLERGRAQNEGRPVGNAFRIDVALLVLHHPAGIGGTRRSERLGLADLAWNALLGRRPLDVEVRFDLGRKPISAQDSFAYALAEQRQWTLLTGDGALRSLAAGNGLAVHGVLWLCDRLEEHAVIANEMLHAGLSAISAHPRCRLPAREVASRLNRYQTDG